VLTAPAMMSWELAQLRGGMLTPPYSVIDRIQGLALDQQQRSGIGGRSVCGICG
jgi:hypothetical protein